LCFIINNRAGHHLTLNDIEPHVVFGTDVHRYV
jgi:threonine aldolase